MAHVRRGQGRSVHDAQNKWQATQWFSMPGIGFSSGAVHDAAQDVPADPVGAERVLPGPSEEHRRLAPVLDGAVHGVVRGEPVGRDGREDEKHQQHERGDERIAPQPEPDAPKDVRPARFGEVEAAGSKPPAGMVSSSSLPSRTAIRATRSRHRR